MYVILWELLCVLLEKRDIRVDIWRYRCESTWLFLFYYLLLINSLVNIVIISRHDRFSWLRSV